MVSIDIYSRIPIYQQIIDGIKREILSKILLDGDQVQSVREFSVSAGVNPNTVSKAYLELERQNFLTAAVGKGYFVAKGAYQKLHDAALAEAKETFLEAKEKLLAGGVTTDTLVSWIFEMPKHEEQRKESNV